jgi:hypothetical protein
MTISFNSMRAVSFLLVSLIACITPHVRAQVSIVGDLSQDHEARPGETYSGSIVVRNDSNEPQEAKLYQTDYLFSFDGTNDYAEPGSTPRSNARWVSFSPSFLVVPPQQSVTVNFTVAIPKPVAGKELAGTYWSMLMVEGIAKGSAESSGAPKNKQPEMGLRQTLRYGIQIATHVAGTGTKKVNFTEPKLTRKSDGAALLQVDLEDSGTLGFRPEVYVELFDSSGTSKGKFPGTAYRMYPGTSVRQTIDLGPVPTGSYKALVVVDAGGDDVFGAQYTLQF